MDAPLAYSWPWWINILVFLALVGAGLAGNHFKVPLFLNANFVLGGLFAMLALQVFGTRLGVVAAVLISLPLAMPWGHAQSALILVGEVAAVGALNRRHRFGFVQADALYWLFLGMPLAYAFHRLNPHLSNSQNLLFTAKGMVNGLTNVLGARILFAAYRLKGQKRSLPSREAVYNLLAFFVLCPVLILLATGVRGNTENGFSRYFAILLSWLVVSLVFAELASRKVTDALESLERVTRDLPAQLASGAEGLPWPESDLVEVNQLMDHFRVMAGLVTEQFKGVRNTNTSLEQRVAEEGRQLTEMIHHFDFIFEHAPIAITKVVDNILVLANGKAEEMLQYPREETHLKPIRNLYVSGEAFEAFYAQAHAALLRGQVFDGVEALVKKGGETILVRHIGRALDANDLAKGTIWLLEDVTQRLHAEALQQDLLERFKTTTSRVPGAIFQFCMAKDGTFSMPFATETLRELYGVTPGEVALDASRVFDALHPEDLPRFLDSLRESARTLSPWQNEHRLKPGGSGLRHLSLSAMPQGGEDGSVLWHGYLADITEGKRLEADLNRAQKLEGLGLLAGGVAHDMNNALGAILMLASAHKDLQAPDTSIHGALGTIEEACLQGKDLLRGLLGFARHGLVEERVLDLNALVLEVSRPLESWSCALELDLAPDLGPILGEASALTQLLTNLCLNALEAMPGQRGTLTLRTRNLDPGWIEVQVGDTGRGMDKDLLERALDPFFSTKPQGKGLGLALAHSTMTAHRGHLELCSEPGRGTQVILGFPRWEAAPIPLEGPPAAAPIAAGGSLHVLLVDDDELIQKSMQAILGLLGHRVSPAGTGEEALALLESGLCPDAVILDMNMPGMGGLGTLPRLRGLMPWIPVLLATGRVDQVALDLVAAHPGVSLLSKPYSVDDLQAFLQALGQAPAI